MGEEGRHSVLLAINSNTTLSPTRQQGIETRPPQGDGANQAAIEAGTAGPHPIVHPASTDCENFPAILTGFLPCRCRFNQAPYGVPRTEYPLSFPIHHRSCSRLRVPTKACTLDVGIDPTSSATTVLSSNVYSTGGTVTEIAPARERPSFSCPCFLPLVLLRTQSSIPQTYLSARLAVHALLPTAPTKPVDASGPPRRRRRRRRREPKLPSSIGTPYTKPVPAPQLRARLNQARVANPHPQATESHLPQPRLPSRKCKTACARVFNLTISISTVGHRPQPFILSHGHDDGLDASSESIPGLLDQLLPNQRTFTA